MDYPPKRSAGFSPIATIPIELLEKILVLAIRGDYFRYEHPPGDDMLDPTDWERLPTWPEHVQLSAVCKPWRQAALECAAFWTSVPFLHLMDCPRFSHMLDRCNSAPLSLKMRKSCRVPPKKEIHRTPILFPPSRIRDIVFGGTAQVQELYLVNLICTESPNLEVIALHPHGGYGDVKIDSSPSCFAHPEASRVHHPLANRRCSSPIVPKSCHPSPHLVISSDFRQRYVGCPRFLPKT
ncbi:hypothetical protein BDV98DRAFT_47731 [Pterulicium gracile]|uniref:Uncharacterized protein n=1 Tax=Pterulicium gracile TaxID=1884261 RepID=A0A5C3QNZ9_9AGAR|nr:hypothetical protein BDV98DRAFT_47731 [Pterula gracilis]